MARFLILHGAAAGNPGAHVVDVADGADTELPYAVDAKAVGITGLGSDETVDYVIQVEDDADPLIIDGASGEEVARSFKTLPE